MTEKGKVIKSYVLQKTSELKKHGIFLPQIDIENAILKLEKSSDSFEKIKEIIDNKVNSILYLIKIEDIKDDVSDMTSLPLPNIGITLNNQDIDLLMIANSKTKEELNNAISKISNLKGIKFDLDDDIILSREMVFKKYLDLLTSKEEYFKNKDLIILKKLEFLKRASSLSQDEIQIILNIVCSCESIDEIINKMNLNFDKAKVHGILKILKDVSPIEKSGIKSTSIETYQNLYDLLSSYNSITIDEEVKYGNVALQDKTFDFSRLKKSLDFAKSLNKKVRLNALIFYKDCPREFFNLEVNEENKKIVKDSLIRYVSETTEFIADNGYLDVVRSIDVFNELLNRFPMDSYAPYLYRGDINIGNKKDDNLNPLWLKFLSIEDLCDIISVARKNLPNVDFTFNDDNLTDPRKIKKNIEIIKRIQQYEQKHNIRLIDSIGTQMHIDNNISEEQIRNMFYYLKEINLPIEVTEFDLAMTNVNYLSVNQIERLRQRKINEIYNVVKELREECNIVGFTIWSKTDKQNFRLSLENESRIKKGLETVETLYGGMYKEDMTPKNKTLLKNISPNYNYHTHTKRCGHAEITSDSEYVSFARKTGITQLGFSDHIASCPYELPNTNSRMCNGEMTDYIKDINKLKEENKDMTILCGFEAEYDKLKESYLGDIRKQVDYLILGQHYVNKGLSRIPQKNNAYYPLEYALVVCEAMDSGLFDIVAHPDIFMQYRDFLKTEEEKKRFMKNALLASRMICNKAKELDIPLEINFGGVNSSIYLSDKELSYPHSLFWKVASEVQAPVMYGVDAHSPRALIGREYCKRKISNVISTSRLNFVPFDYNPVEARKNNKKLQDLLAKRQMDSLSYEASYVNEALSSLIPKISSNVDNNTIADILEKLVDSRMQSIISLSTREDEKLFKEINEISRSTKIPQDEKKYRLQRLKRFIEEVNIVVQHEGSLLEKMKNSIKNAKEMGCTTKEEYKEMIVQQIEEKTAIDEEKKTRARVKIETFKEKNRIETLPKEKEKTKKRIHKKINKPNNGYIKIISMLMVLSGSIGILLGITIFILDI